MTNHKCYTLMLLLFIAMACKKDTQVSGEWLVPSDEVHNGGPGKDGIPSVDNPEFSSVNEVDFLSDEDLVLGVEVGGVVRGYPHIVLDWHEIVNDQHGGENVAITYCPLTGTGVAWDRELNGEVTTFGVSGLLYNSNLMPYDRASGSTWSQQRLDCVHGDLIRTPAITHELVETTWATWKQAYPEAEVLNLNTGFNRDYGVYPYGDYKTNQNRLLFPISNEDTRLSQKKRVLGVFNNGAVSGYTVDGGEALIDVVEDQLGGESLVIVRSSSYNFAVAFKNPDNLQFTAVDQLPVVMEDQNGNQYDWFGKVVAGNSDASALSQPTAFIGYWFSWGAFYPNLSLYED